MYGIMYTLNGLMYRNPGICRACTVR